MTTLEATADRFWRHVEKGNGCWQWRGGRSGKYGRFHAETMMWAHRFAYELRHGPLLPGFCVCHRCDNPLCVRADHMFPGTRSTNIADRTAKRRESRGPAHSEAIRQAWMRRRARMAASEVLVRSR